MKSLWVLNLFNLTANFIIVFNAKNRYATNSIFHRWECDEKYLFKEVWTLGKWKYWCRIDHKTRYLGYADYEIHAHWMGQLRGYYVC